MPETQQPIIVIILIIYSPYFLKYLVELWEYISGRTAISSSLYVSYKQLSFGWSAELKHTFYYMPCPLINQTPWNDATSLTTYTTHCHVCDTHTHTCILYIYIYILGLGIG